MTARLAPVAIVGGGIAGLAAAWELHGRGVPFVLYERDARLGGLVHSEEADGFLLEGGPDSILASKPEGLALCRELGLEDQLVPTRPDQRTVWVRRRGALHPLPEGMVLGVPTRLWPLLRSGLFSWRGKLRLAMEPWVPARRIHSHAPQDLQWIHQEPDGGPGGAVSPQTQEARRIHSGAPYDAGRIHSDPPDDESLADFVRRRLGREAVDRIGQPLLAGIHAGDAERLSARATFPRLVDLEQRHGSLARGLHAAASAGPISAFVSLRRGLGGVVQALVDRLPAAALRVSSPVCHVRREGGHYRLALETAEEAAAEAVIVAVPAPVASRMLQGTLPPRARAILEAVRFASTATVLLGYRREDVGHALDGYGFVCSPGEGRLLACTFLSTKLPGRAPEGHVLLRAFVGGVRDPGVLDLEDQALSALVIAELRTLLGLRGSPVLARVYRWREAIPQMEVGHRERMAELERALADVPGLFLTGAGLRGAGIPDVVADARHTAAVAAGFSPA